MISHVKYWMCIVRKCKLAPKKSEVLNKGEQLYHMGYDKINNDLDIIHLLSSVQKLKACVIALMEDKARSGVAK